MFLLQLLSVSDARLPSLPVPLPPLPLLPLPLLLLLDHEVTVGDQLIGFSYHSARTEEEETNNVKQ